MSELVERKVLKDSILKTGMHMHTCPHNWYAAGRDLKSLSCGTLGDIRGRTLAR
jgi:hypothetical protein